jgi:hypothetical protein
MKSSIISRTASIFCTPFAVLQPAAREACNSGVTPCPAITSPTNIEGVSRMAVHGGLLGEFLSMKGSSVNQNPSSTRPDELTARPSRARCGIPVPSRRGDIGAWRGPLCKYREFHRFGPRRRLGGSQKRHEISLLRAQFPTHPNREFFAALQGIKSGDQGSFRRDQGIPPSSTICAPGDKSDHWRRGSCRTRVQRAHRRWAIEGSESSPSGGETVANLTSSIRVEARGDRRPWLLSCRS